MNILSSFLVAAGLSMDNLAVTLAAGCERNAQGRPRLTLQVSLLFALAHFVMFALGYEGGALVHISRSVGPWVACGILAFIGVHMIKNAFEQHLPSRGEIFTSLHTQVALALATSLDALFVGAGMALAREPFWQTQAALALCVFITSFSGFYVGRCLGKKFGRNVEIAGGSVLVFLGVKILLEGTGIW